jgi:transposase-like protein
VPLKVITLTELWIEILLAPDRHGLTVTEVCRRYGISRKTFYAHRSRYRADGVEGLEPRSQDRERQNAADLWQECWWVFAQPNGKATDPRADYSDWKALLTEADVREARLHDARHTAATILLVLNVATRAVMGVMGWSQASMTTR